MVSNKKLSMWDAFELAVKESSEEKLLHLIISEIQKIDKYFTMESLYERLNKKYKYQEDIREKYDSYYRIAKDLEVPFTVSIVDDPQNPNKQLISIQIDIAGHPPINIGNIHHIGKVQSIIVTDNKYTILIEPKYDGLHDMKSVCKSLSLVQLLDVNNINPISFNDPIKREILLSTEYKINRGIDQCPNSNNVYNTDLYWYSMIKSMFANFSLVKYGHSIEKSANILKSYRGTGEYEVYVHLGKRKMYPGVFGVVDVSGTNNLASILNPQYLFPYEYEQGLFNVRDSSALWINNYNDMLYQFLSIPDTLFTSLDMVYHP